MTDEEIDAIEERANAASEGPWQAEPNTHAGRVWVQRSPVKHRWHGKDCEPLFSIRDKDGYEQKERDAAFIAAARSDVPALVASLRDTRTALRQLLDDAWWATGGTVESGYVVSEDLIEAARVLVSDVSTQETKA